jgi:hypothetical protein
MDAEYSAFLKVERDIRARKAPLLRELEKLLGEAAGDGRNWTRAERKRHSELWTEVEALDAVASRAFEELVEGRTPGTRREMVARGSGYTPGHAGSSYRTPEPSGELWKTAYHEAGHVAATLLEGRSPEAIVRTGGSGRAWGGSGSVFGTLAGPCAEVLAFGGDLDGLVSGGSFPAAWRLDAEKLARHSPERLRLEAERVTADLRRNWRGVEAVAELLFERGSVDAPELARTFRGAEGIHVAVAPPLRDLAW